MNKFKFLLPIIFASLLIVNSSCKKEESVESSDNESNNETKISRYYDTESHNMGLDCMTCHKTGGSGEGRFTIAGTVYDTTKTTSLPNSTIRLYTGANATGSLKATIEVDGKGNFYTTESIDFGGGLFPSVQGITSVNHMGSSISAGNCNSCHNSSNRIWGK